MIGEKLTLDINNKKDYPKVIDKEEGDAYLILYIEYENGVIYKANVESFTSKGTYVIRIFEKM